MNLLPVPVDTSALCPCCGGPTDDVAMTEAPLLRHGGYGAARRTTWRICRGDVWRCGWAITHEVQEVKP